MLFRSITIYPNPTNGIAYLNLGASFQEIKSIEVYNAYGKKMVLGFYNTKNSEFGCALDFSNYPNGIYYIEIGLTDRRITKKIIVSK